jgi:predicted dehydrogenase
MTTHEQSEANVDSGRRRFVQATAAAGAGALLGLPAWAQEPPTAEKTEETATPPPTEPVEELAVAIIGTGSQGRNLITKALKAPGIRFVAVCDIWPYHQSYAANILKKYDQPVNVYADHREMLAKEPRLDAVIVATPDWVHADQTMDCLKAGKHVYCEKEMANTVEAMRRMVRAARETGRLLQIGHQRRSNPRYWHAIKLIENDKVLGRITHVYAQWHRARWYEQGWPDGKELDADTLKRHGYDTMDRFRNWRWYRKYSGGAMADLGSHQVDVFNWILKARPKSVQASGGLDYYTDQQREWYDNVTALYLYETPSGPVRATYQVLNTTSFGGYYEVFMGDEGTMVVSEDPQHGFMMREVRAAKREWEDESAKVEKMGVEAIELKIGETLTAAGAKDPEGQRLLAESQKPIHLLHLENFFTAVRKGTPLSCPPEVGFETGVAVLKANEAVATGKLLEFTSEEFSIAAP